MADEMAAEQKLAAEPEQAGYRVWCGTANQMGSCMAQRSDVLYQFVGPSPEALRPIISTLLAATPRS